MFDVEVVIVFNALTFLWSALLVSRIRVPSTADQDAGTTPEAATVPAATEPPTPAAEEEKESFLSESTAGFKTIWGNRDLRLVTLIYAAQTIVAGASIVFAVAIAVQMTDFGPKGVGYLDSALGVGAILGGLVAIGRATAQRIATDFGIGVIFWALPLLLAAAWPNTFAALAAMFIIGFANPIVDVNASTILQRIADDEVMGRVFGALETALIGAMALGSIIMPIDHLGRGLAGPHHPRPGHHHRRAPGDGPAAVARRDPPRARGPGDPSGRSRSSSPSSRSPSSSYRQPAGPGRGPCRRRGHQRGQRGRPLLRRGVRALTATHAGGVLSSMGAGDPFGEIALLRDVPRTATVTADEASVLLALDRDVFLDAVTGNSEVSGRADDLIARRIPTY